MTIDLAEISHASTVQALAYAQDYHTNHYSPTYPPFTYRRYDHSEHIEVLASWGYQGYFFIQSRIKLTVLYGLVADWTDEIAMRGWIFWRNPITGVWHTELESQETSVHHWQQAHAHIKQEETDMALKRAKIDTYYPATHTADVTIYPLPGEEMAGVPLAQHIGPELASLLPDCTLAIFYDTEPPSPYITSILDGVPPPWITPTLHKNEPFFIPAMAWDIVYYTPLLGYIGPAWWNRMATWRLSPSSSWALGSQIVVPHTGAATIKIYLAMELDQSAGGHVYLVMGSAAIAQGEDCNMAGRYRDSIVDVTGGQKALVIATLDTNRTLTAGDLLRLGLARWGNHASDDAPGDMHFLGLALTYN